MVLTVFSEFISSCFFNKMFPLNVNTVESEQILYEGRYYFKWLFEMKFLIFSVP